MRVLALLPIVALAACTTQDVGTPSGKAHFAAYPDSLFDAFESACGGPAQSFRRPEPDMVECREYLPPEATAPCARARAPRTAPPDESAGPTAPARPAARP